MTRTTKLWVIECKSRSANIWRPTANVHTVRKRLVSRLLDLQAFFPKIMYRIAEYGRVREP